MTVKFVSGLLVMQAPVPSSKSSSAMLVSCHLPSGLSTSGTFSPEARTSCTSCTYMRKSIGVIVVLLVPMFG